jgi:DNA-binding Xre family transcriptional regulator
MLSGEQHVLTLLKTTMRVLGYSNRDIERQLKLSGSYLSRLFSGDIDLRFSHILNICRAMGIEPEEILLLAYPYTQEPKSEAAQRLAAYMERLQSPQEALKKPERTEEERQLDEAVERVVGNMLEKLGAGVLDQLPPLPWPEPEALPEPLPLPEPVRPRRRRRSKKSKASKDGD